MEKNTKAYIAVNIGFSLSPEMNRINWSEEKKVVGNPTVTPIAHGVSVLSEGPGKLSEFTFDGFVITHDGKYWEFNTATTLGICVIATLISSLTQSTILVDDKGNFEMCRIPSLLLNLKGKSVLETLFTLINVILDYSDDERGTLCWVDGQECPMALLTSEAAGSLPEYSYPTVYITKNNSSKVFYNYIDGIDDSVGINTPIDPETVGLPLQKCLYAGNRINIKKGLVLIEEGHAIEPTDMLFNEISTRHLNPHDNTRGESSRPSAYGFATRASVRLEDHDTPGFRNEHGRERRGRKEVMQEMRDRDDDRRDRRRSRYDRYDERPSRLVLDLANIVDDIEDMKTDIDRLFTHNNLNRELEASEALAISATITKELTSIISRLTSRAASVGTCRTNGNRDIDPYLFDILDTVTQGNGRYRRYGRRSR